MCEGGKRGKKQRLFSKNSFRGGTFSAGGVRKGPASSPHRSTRRGETPPCPGLRKKKFALLLNPALRGGKKKKDNPWQRRRLKNWPCSSSQGKEENYEFHHRRASSAPSRGSTKEKTRNLRLDSRNTADASPSYWIEKGKPRTKSNATRQNLKSTKKGKKGERKPPDSRREKKVEKERG